MARGFFAELNYQAQQTDKRRRQQQAAAYRAQAAASRHAEAALKAAERAYAAATRASAADQKAAQKEAARLQVEAQLAEVASRNGGLANEYAEIDGLLAEDARGQTTTSTWTPEDHHSRTPAVLARRAGAPRTPAPQRCSIRRSRRSSLPLRWAF